MKEKQSIEGQAIALSKNTSLYIKECKRMRKRYTERETKLYSFAGWAFLAGLCWGLTPYFYHIATIARGSKVPGGEIVIPLIPVFCLCLHIADGRRRK